MADRYAVNTPFTWDGTVGTKWATTSGGAGGASIPTSADDVYVDGASGSGAITISSGNTGCRSINTTGFTGNIGGSTAISIAGSITIGAGSTWLSTSTLTLSATTAQTITTNGKVMGGAITFNGVAGVWQLQDNLFTNDRVLTLTNGTLDLNGKNLLGSTFSSTNSNSRNITSGSGGTITLTGNGTTIISGATLTSLTLSGGTVTFNLTYAGATSTRTVSWGSTSGATPGRAINLSVPFGSDTLAITNNSQLGNINLTGFAGTVGGSGNIVFSGSLTVGTGTTWSNTGALTPNAQGATTQVITTNGRSLATGSINFNSIFGPTFQLADNLLCGSATLSAGTLDLNGKTLTAATFGSSTTNSRGITTGSGGKIVVTGNSATVISFLSMTNFTLTGALTIDATYAGATGTRTFAWGSSSGGNQSAKAPSLNITAGTDSVTLTAFSWSNNLDFTGFAGTLSSSTGDQMLGGDLTLSSGMTYSSVADLYFDHVTGATHHITSAGKTITSGIFCSTDASTYQLMDNLVTTEGLNADLGTLDFNGHNATADYLAINGIGTKSLAMGTSTLTLTGSADAFDNLAPSGFSITYSAGAKIVMTNAALKTFTGGGFNFPILEQGGTGQLTILDANTFEDIQRTAAGTIAIPAGMTTTVNALTLGSSGAFRSSSGGTYADLVKTSGTVSISNATITDVHAAGGATFDALTSNGNVDGGGNTGWNFGAAAVSTQGLLVMFQ